MKSFTLIISSTLALTACSYPSTSNPPSTKIANPASEFCIHHGGTSILKKDAQGNSHGICQLPNGSQIEEWEFYRQSVNHP